MSRSCKTTLAKGTLLLLLLLCTETQIVAAQTDYKLLAPLPTATNNIENPPEKQDPSGYIASVFRLGVGIAAALAVLVIAGNGLRYMLSDVVTSKSGAVQGIKNALWGLLLALGAYVLLNTISPQFTAINLRPARMVVSPTQSEQLTVGTQNTGSHPQITGLMNSLQTEIAAEEALIRTADPLFRSSSTAFQEATYIQYSDPDRYAELMQTYQTDYANALKIKNKHTALKAFASKEFEMVARLNASPTKATADSLLGAGSYTGEVPAYITEKTAFINNPQSGFDAAEKSELLARLNKVLADIQGVITSAHIPR